MTDSATEYCTVSGREYLAALSRFIEKHESALAAYYQPRPRPRPPLAPPAALGPTGPSWGTILTLGILPDAPSSTPAPTPPPVLPRRDPLVLHFDPHHLYYVLLKFDELGLSTGDALDTKVDQGALHAKPMTIVDSGATPGTVDIVHEGNTNAPSLLAGMFGFGGASDRAGPADDSRSVMSGKSSFSFGSGWWGLGGGGSGSGANGTASAESTDEPTLVRHVYSSCTKLPALKLSPFVFRSRPPTASASKASQQPPWQAVQGFEDCPPPSTCVPLSLFHSLTSLYLEDLDPRAFTGWDVVSFQLKKLEVVRGGIEDVGELICDCVVEDEQRSQRRRNDQTLATETVGAGRRRRTEQGAGGHGDAVEGNDDDHLSYPRPSKLAWSSLRHLSLHDNALTFVPAPPLSHLSLLTSLDLSSNLLISVPPALAHLTSLRSLNLRDNMIDNLHALATILGAVQVVNLAHNRLENLSGLDRLLALERLDLRANRVWEAFEVSRLARLPNLTELWVRDNPFARDVVLGGEEGWRVKCLAYFEEERLVRGGGDVDRAGPEVKIDGKAIEGRSERKLVEAEVAKRSGGAFLPDRTMRRRASTGIGLGGGRESSSNGNGNGENGNGPKKVIVEPRRRVVTAPLVSASSSRQRQSTAETVSGPSLSSSPNTAPPVPASPPQLKPAKRRKPRRIVDLDAPLASSMVAQPHQSDSDATTTSSGPEGGAGGGRLAKQASQTLATVQEPSEPLAPNTPSKRSLSSQQKFASSPSRLRSPQVGHAASTFDPSTSPTSSKMSRRERVSASTYAASNEGATASSSGGEGGPGGGGEALRRKIEKLREEVGENWLSVLGEREARASQQQQQQQQRQQQEQEQERQAQEGKTQKADSEVTAEASSQSGEGHRRDEPSVEGLAVSAGVRVVKKKSKKKKGKGK